MTKRIVYENLEKGIHISLAAKAALQHFSSEHLAATVAHPTEAPAARVFIFNGTAVNAEVPDTVETLVTRWMETHEANRLKAALRRRVQEANPELDDLLSILGLTTAIGLGNTLDWIAQFSAIADDSVVEAFGQEVLDEFKNRGYTANEPLAGNAIALREQVNTHREAYGRYIVGLFLFELSKGRAIERKFDASVAHYDSMCPLSH